MAGMDVKKLKTWSLNQFYKYHLYKRLIWCFVVMFVLPILLIGGYNAMYSLSKNQQEAKVFLEESSTQIANNISYYLTYHMSLLDEVAENAEIIEELAVYEEADWNRKSDIENHIRLVLGHTFGTSSAIETLELITRDHAYFYYPSPVSNGKFSESSLLSLEARQVLMTVSAKEVPNDDTKYVILTRGIYDEDDVCLGNIVVALDLTYFNKACYENVTDLLNKVMIIDGDNRIVSASDETLVGRQAMGDTSGSISSYKTILNTELIVVNTIPMMTLLQSALTLFSLTLFMTAVFAALALILALVLTKSVTRPINRLMVEMNKPEVEKYVEDHGNDEYHLIIESFNKMNGHIVEAIQGQYALELQEMELRELRKEAELSALQQQINPHFLYNTLESIYWYGQLKGDEEISEIVSALGNYLRVIIDKGRERVEIIDEFESVNNYLFLQNKRFDERIIHSFEIPPELKTKKILKLTMQPVVEDIIATNLDDVESNINLTISIREDDACFVIQLQGKAVAYYLKLSTVSNLEMNGIKSVDERLSLYYGEGYGVDIDSEQEVINIVIPVQNDVEGR